MTDPDSGSADITRHERFFPETGQVVRGAFLDFFNRWGLEMCGYPITPESVEGNRPIQFFQRLALEQPAPGVVHLLPIGAELLAARDQLRQLRGGIVGPATFGETLLPPPPFAVDNVVGRLPVHLSARYAQRPMTDIRRLVIHRTGAPENVGPETIADYHVHRQGWPGIGYHFVVGADGHVWQTNGLVVVSFHAREFNPDSVGIALAGRFDASPPLEAQLAATARLCAWLMAGLGLRLDAVQGHRELVRTPCPGEGWQPAGGWGERLRALVRALLGVPAEPAPEAIPAGEPPATAAPPPDHPADDVPAEPAADAAPEKAPPADVEPEVTPQTS